MTLWRLFFLLAILASISRPCTARQETPLITKSGNDNVGQPQEADGDKDSILFLTDFDKGLGDWEFSDAAAWRLERLSDQTIMQQFLKTSNFKPEFRSPLHQAILKGHEFRSFELSVEVRSTHEPYGHRDVCLFFGYQNPSQFYYAHLGQKTDPHCNQIFIVNGADRAKITASTTPGTRWDDRWHQVRVVRCSDSGRIEVYFDDQANPAMTASDKTFETGRIGVGSFDDTADWAKLRVRKLTTAKENVVPENKPELPEIDKRSLSF